MKKITKIIWLLILILLFALDTYLYMSNKITHPKVVYIAATALAFVIGIYAGDDL